MKRYSKQLAFLLPLFFLAAVVSSYAPPTAAPSGANTDGPITIGDEIGLKTGGLSVTTFQARGNSSLMQDAYFNGQINGGHPSDTSSTVTFGETSAPYPTIVSGSVYATNGKSDTLASATPALKNVCATANGTYVLCTTSTTTTPPPPSTDVCPNIAGDQTTVPSGMEIDPTSGDCLLILGGGGHAPSPTQGTGMAAADITLVNSSFRGNAQGAVYGKITFVRSTPVAVPGDPSQYVLDTVEGSLSYPGGTPAVVSLGTINFREGSYTLQFVGQCANVPGSSPTLYRNNAAVPLGNLFHATANTTYSYEVRCI